MRCFLLPRLFMLITCWCSQRVCTGNRKVLCFVAVDYHTVSSEMIFSTFLVRMMCKLGLYLSYYGLGCHLRASKHVEG